MSRPGNSSPGTTIEKRNNLSALSYLPVTFVTVLNLSLTLGGCNVYYIYKPGWPGISRRKESLSVDSFRVVSAENRQRLGGFSV